MKQLIFHLIFFYKGDLGVKIGSLGNFRNKEGPWGKLHRWGFGAAKRYTFTGERKEVPQDKGEEDIHSQKIGES